MNDKTLVFPIIGNRVLLGMKKVRFGAGKWNGFGGGVEKGETPLEGAIRELWEEASVKTSAQDMEYKGTVKFRFPAKPAWDQDVHMFLTRSFIGTPQESDEMQPAYFDLDQVPYHAMWAGDEYWLRPVLLGNVVDALVIFKETGDTFARIELYKPERKTIIN